MNLFDKFTQNSKKVMECAKQAAMSFGHGYIGSEHLLIGILSVDCEAKTALNNKGVTKEKAIEKTEEIVGSSKETPQSFEYTPRTKTILQGSFEHSAMMGQEYISPKHILLSIIEEGESVAYMVIVSLGVDIESLYKELDQGSEKQAEENKKTPTLDKYGIDLTASAKNEKLDPVIGRDEEISRIIQILSRRTKNNPVLIGEPGVGKSAIAEGLAQKLTLGDIPEILKDKKLYLLDLAGMLAGAKYRGEFEERLKQALKEVKENKNIILFIDEIHTLIGTGASEGAMDAANILKPSLARGEIQLIGATTLNEYKKNIEKDSALERRFAPVKVGEPTCEEAILILKGLRDRYEAHHKVKITDDAIEAAVVLSDRYISDRFLPDKAIDVMDEAASKAKIKNSVIPPEIKELEANIESVALEKQAAIDSQDYEKAAILRDKEKDLKEVLESAVNTNKNKFDVEVDKEDISDIVALWTGIPVRDISEDEGEKLLRLEETLSQNVVGQKEAIKAVSRAIRRARAGLSNPDKPIGSFIFLGPTGVGKTELSKALSKAMFGQKTNMIRLDMSEYMEKHAVSKLIGSPPGYVGFEEGGQLTEKVRRKPYSVILFDEIEKAHPDAFNILLQILDDGILTDSQGRTVDFKNTVIIMTSNIGAKTIKDKTMGFGNTEKEESYEETKKHMMDTLKKNFKPEFINRIDDIIVFTSLSREDIREIVDIMVDELSAHIENRGVSITVSHEAKDYLANKGYDKDYGARPLRRTIQSEIEDSLSEMILKGELSLGKKVEVSLEGDKLKFTVE